MPKENSIVRGSRTGRFPVILVHHFAHTLVAPHAEYSPSREMAPTAIGKLSWEDESKSPPTRGNVMGRKEQCLVLRRIWRLCCD